MSLELMCLAGRSRSADDPGVRPELPTGTVTFLFTDVEGSTSLLNELGAETYADALAEHRAVIREACTGNGGVEVDTQGDASFFAFPTAPGALAAASDFTARLAADGPIRVRVGVHTGTPFVGEEGYVGPDVHRAARIAAAGHGGQILVSASTASLVDTELTDLGEHRFKDLGAPERVFQLGGGELPGLKSLYRTNLPVPATPFLGRARELQDVVELLTGADARLVTLTGPGGSGKTRLLLHAAAEASDGFPDGMFWIPLAPLRDASALATAFAQSLEVREQPGIAAMQSLVRAFAGKRALILVDNCEHVLDSAAAIVRAFVDGCPRLVVAASSRERLGLRAERIYAVPPMTASDGEHLFVERASAVSPSFRSDDHVAAICEAVDELPLAIELAAARVRSLSTRSIRERLAESLGLLATRDRDVEARQRTLEATIEWSYDLLGADEQRILRELSVFAGGCTLAAAEAVAGSDLDSLESLLDKSLIRHRIDEAGNDRYWLLETIREFAASRLSVAGEAERAAARHMEFFLMYAPQLLGRAGRPTSDELVDHYKADAANFRIALARALARGDAASALRFVRCLGRLLYRLAPPGDAYSIARASLALPGGADDDRAYALVRAANFAALLGGEVDAAQDQLSEAEALFEQLDDGAGLAEVFACRSTLASIVGDYAEAIGFAEKQAVLARELGDADLARFADLRLADALSARAMEEGDRAAADRSRAIYKAYEREIRDFGSTFEETILYTRLAIVEFSRGAHAEAISLGRRGLLGVLELGVARAYDQLLVMGWAAAAHGMTKVGVRLVSAAMRQYREDGMDIERSGHAQMERFERSSRQALGDDGYEAAVREGEALSDEEATQVALSVTTA
jgi:predicted ATPase/class 3 adenylate cyclase